MQKSHRREINQMLYSLHERDREQKWARCLVIDFKDISGRYDELYEIEVTEKKFTAFFKGDSAKSGETQGEIYNLIRDNLINFFINEGSLKASLIKKIFHPDQSKFLQDTEKGSSLFCQLCEVIMNGFKQGCGVIVNGHYFDPNHYITTITEDLEERTGLAEQRLPFIPSLVTFYPHHYQEMYSDTSEYYRLITTIFRTTHQYDRETTIITID